ncbi:hypothetical protein J421_0125 [Gemmatirosa kalamazoonensis]|uniref:O-antigen ligase-related domain-containing protein n=1 Tax=Gemmatirosa kalamazoonensis TaxID=861299 RepID=W0RB23_9BACT|nr:O-antigen ligase family protein [Gemmatirosa kalamazoonensis]AHG87662.1 hypothetical protein J421_0125 [Gemmatirosa kalamazoonensis]
MHTTLPPVGSTGDGWSTPPAVPARRLFGGRRRPAPAAGGRASRARWVVAAVAVASALALLATDNPAAAAGPAVLAMVAYALWTLPLRYVVFTLLVPTAVAFTPPRSVTEQYEIQASGILYEHFLKPLEELLNGYLSRVTGVGALAISGTEMLYVVLIGLAALRALRGQRIDTEGWAPSVRILLVSGIASLVVLAVLEVSGVLRGGDARSSLFQIRHLALMPLQLALFTYAFRDRRDFVIAALLVTAGACLKIFFGSYFLLHDAWPRGIEPEAMTDHEDSVLYVVVMFMWCAAWIHRPRRRLVLPTLAIVAWTFTGIVLNDRRIAYVSVAASFGLLYVLLRGPIKRRMTRGAVAMLPLLAAYLVIAKSHEGGIFKPGHEFMSVSDVNDPSNMWREMENFNLLATLKVNPVIGSGWGHEYLEIVKAADISVYMPQYRLTAHNSLLWLLGVSGIVGFTFIWMPIPIGVFLAARSYRNARDPVDRTIAVTVLAVIVSYINLAWGDMGTQASYATTLLALALAASGKLARATGAWPASARLLGAQHVARRAPADDRLTAGAPASAGEPPL